MRIYGDGSRAIVRVGWESTRAETGHVFVAENHGGEILFIDPQSGRMDVSDYFDMAARNSVLIARIDNLEVTELVNECCSSRRR